MILDLPQSPMEMVRGDTFVLPISLNCGTREYPVDHVLGANEAVYIGITKPNQPFEEAEIRCMLDHTCVENGKLLFILEPAHTVNMYPGKYYMTVKFVSGKSVQTLVDQKLFFINGTNPER